MKNKNLCAERRLAISVFVITLNVLLSLLSLTNCFGQNLDVSSQKPLDVEVVAQTDCPLLITQIGVDNTAESYQIINFAIQNISSKNIKAYVLLNSYKSRGAASMTGIFQKSFVPQLMFQESIREERVNIKSDGKMFLEFDYVEFEDGSVWGEDSLKQSEHILGMKEGRKNAISQLRELLNGQDKNALSNLLRQEVSEIKASVPNNKKSEKWQRGFTTGYRLVIGQIQSVYEKQGIEGASLKLKEIDK